MAFLFFCFFFLDEIAFSSILRNELKRLASGTIVSFTKKSQVSANFKLTRTPTIYGKHGIMVKPIKTLELHYQMIQILIIYSYYQ